MFNGCHVVVFSNDAEADRALMGKLLGRNAVDAGDGWMIYAMPPTELAVHPLDGPIRHELHMMCDDIEKTRRELLKLGVKCDPVQDLGYGLVSGFQMPGGAVVGFYQPRHDRPI